MATKTLTIGEMTGLWRVKPTKILLWPESILPTGMTRLNKRGDAGYVVDMDQPYEKVLCWAKEKFFEPVPDNPEAQKAAREKVQDVFDFPRPIVNTLVEKGYIKNRPLRRQSAKRSTVIAEQEKRADPSSEGAPPLDTPPKGRSRSRARRTKEDDDAAEGTAGASSS